MPEVERPFIGGQAVLEGVMMRSPTSFAVVVRRRDGSLAVRERAMTDYRTGWKKLPFFRGMYSLVESLRLGHEALRFSADWLEKDWYGAASATLSAFGLSLFSMATKDADDATTDPEKKGGVPTTMLLVMVLFIVALPQIAAAIAKRIFHIEANVTSPQFQAMTGFFKL